MSPRRSGDDSIGEANWHFHQKIHRAAHSPRLMTQIKQAARVVPTNFLTLFPDHEKHSLDDHQELLDAFGAKDVDGPAPSPNDTSWTPGARWSSG